MSRASSRGGSPVPENPDLGAAPSPAGVSLLGVWPDIAGGVTPEERGVVERALVVPVVRVARDEDLTAVLAGPSVDAFSFVVVEGEVLKETTLATIPALELLGPGDILVPPLTASQQLEFRAVSRYVALTDASVAVLGARLARVATRWPEVSMFLHGQIAEQRHRASTHLAMLHLPRAADRILALFVDLAERFGRVTPNGIVIRLPLSHQLIGQLTGSRRPTTTLALQHLDDDGLLNRLGDGSWRLTLRGSAG